MEVVTLLSTHCGFDFLKPQPIQEQPPWKISQAIWRMTRSTLSFWNRGRRNSEWGCRMKGWATHRLSGLKCPYFCYRGFYIEDWYSLREKSSFNLTSLRLRIYSPSGEEFLVSLPWTCPIKRLWPSKFGLILERSDPATDSNEWQDDAGLDKDDPLAKYGHYHYLDHLRQVYFILSE